MLNLLRHLIVNLPVRYREWREHRAQVKRGLVMLHSRIEYIARRNDQ